MRVNRWGVWTAVAVGPLPMGPLACLLRSVCTEVINQKLCRMGGDRG